MCNTRVKKNGRITLFEAWFLRKRETRFLGEGHSWIRCVYLLVSGNFFFYTWSARDSYKYNKYIYVIVSTLESIDLFGTRYISYLN